MPEIAIYTTRYCPYCHAAKRLLTRKGVEFTEIDVSGDPKGRSEMVARANGRMTVPQIFIGSTHVGGYDDLPPWSGRASLIRCWAGAMRPRATVRGPWYEHRQGCSLHRGSRADAFGPVAASQSRC